jgi:outer membrane protein assembly factor BamB
MRSKKHLVFLVAGTLLGTLLLWLSGHLLVRAIYHGNAGDYLNVLITDRASHTLDEYLGDYNRLFLRLAVPVLLLLSAFIATPRKVRQTLRSLPGQLYYAARQNLSGVIATISLIFLSCVTGAWIAWSDSAFYKYLLEDTFNAAAAIYQDSFRKRPLLGETDTWAHQGKRSLQGLGTHVPGLAQDGITLVYGMQQAWLVDMDGTVLHSWSVDYDSLQSSNKLIPRSYPETYVYWHQARLSPNGDLLVMIDQFDKTPSGLAMMKIDRNSNVLWVYPHHVHHDFNFDDQGNIYALDQAIRTDTVSGLTLETPYLDEGLLVLSPEGKLLERFSLIDAFSGTDHASFFNGNSYYRQGDYLHTNNVDVLKPGLFGTRSGGGLLLSFNGLSAIAVLDIETRKIVRTWAGYWHQQHDPDLLENGNIILFDNLGAWTPAQAARVIEFNPETYEIVWEYPGKTGQRLFSTYRGRQQVLANGNVLISEFESGRLIEVTREGKTVWEYSCPFRSEIDPEYVCNFVAGRRYRRDELDFAFNLAEPP